MSAGSKGGITDPVQGLVKPQQADDVLPLDARALRQSALPSKVQRRVDPLCISAMIELHNRCR